MDTMNNTQQMPAFTRESLHELWATVGLRANQAIGSRNIRRYAETVACMAGGTAGLWFVAGTEYLSTSEIFTSLTLSAALYGWGTVRCMEGKPSMVQALEAASKTAHAMAFQSAEGMPAIDLAIFVARTFDEVIQMYSRLQDERLMNQLFAGTCLEQIVCDACRRLTSLQRRQAAKDCIARIRGKNNNAQEGGETPGRPLSPQDPACSVVEFVSPQTGETIYVQQRTSGLYPVL